MRDIFSFFEKPKQTEGEVEATVVETLTVLTAYLQAMGVRLGVRDQQVGASPMSAEQIREASRGEIQSRETLAEDTQQPIAGGLHCPKVFGPVNDYECACGKYKRMKHRGVVCETCGVEVIASKARRERFGHIALPSPCLHPLLVGAVATLLGRSEGEVRSTVGGELWDALASLDLETIEAMETGERADLAASLVAAEVPATALMLEVLPVLPPGLRPTSAAPEIDARYQQVLDARDRPATLPEAIDRLFRDEGSLWATVDGWARALFTKPVDYSGVAHLTVDPTLEEGQCRVPRSLLVELYRLWAYGLLESMGYTTTIKSAKRMVEAGQAEGMQAIEQASEGAVVLLAAGPRVVGRRVRAWDAPAIAVDESTAQRLDSRTVTLHVPMSHEAALQCAALDDHARVSPSSRSGWLSRAALSGAFVEGVLEALTSGERDAMDDPWSSIALGRSPTPPDAESLQAWVDQEEGRRQAIRARHEAERTEEEAASGGPSNPYLDYSVDELEVSVRLANCMQNASLYFVRDVCQRTEAEMLKTKGFGRKELKELKEILAAMGLSMGMKL